MKKPMIQKYGYIEGCPACQKLKSRSQIGGSWTGRLGTNQSTDCKRRIMERMRVDPIDRHIVEDYERRSKRDDHPVQKQERSEEPTTVENEDMQGKDQTHKQEGLESALMSIYKMGMDVAEVYSRPRVTTMAERCGLSAGWSMDLTTIDENGIPWDFDNVAMRNKVARKLLEDKPMLLIGSPMCTEFSSWMQLNHKKMAPEIVQERLNKARTHLEFCRKLYAMQIHQGRYFLHEHPLGASSWHESCIQKILGTNGVIKIKADRCQYGLLSRDIAGNGLVRKAIGFMTNSPCVAMMLQKRCPNRNGKVHHRHVRLEGDRTKAAQVYPDGSCKAICQGLLQQLEKDGKGQLLLAQLEGIAEEARDVEQQLVDEYHIVEDDDTSMVEQAWDDVTGAELDPTMVKQARKEEVGYVRKMGLYKKVSLDECWLRTGRKPIQVRWIDVNKGDVKHPNYRSRLVAKEINIYKRQDLFAATPPLEAVKMILSMTATHNTGEILMANDVSRAFFHAKAKRDVYVDLPAEDKEPGDEYRCAKLEHLMYGPRDAAMNWHDEYFGQLIDNGFVQGKASPCTFYHPVKHQDCGPRRRLCVRGQGGRLQVDGNVPQEEV